VRLARSSPWDNLMGSGTQGRTTSRPRPNGCPSCRRRGTSSKVEAPHGPARVAEAHCEGSSAALGIIKVRDSCESLQNLGKRKNESGAGDIKEEDAWQRCSELLPRLRKEHEEAQKWLAAFVDM
jgi:hypothetical protein